MASKPAAKEKSIEDEEEVLQAVILADSFNKRFRPLTTQKPRCLLPICNAPLLDWTFESLALAGVQEAFVICRSHAELVKKAISDSKWSKPGSGMKIVPIMTAKETYSPGDAMRDIYTRGLVTSDFVLVMGDLVSNIRIDEVVRVHKERRKTNKDAIMTMVVKESGLEHRTRAQGESAVFVIDPQTSECLHYEHLQGYPRHKVLKLPREILSGHPEVEIRNDLLDCSIDVCSVEVPSLFQDNFDYLDLRRDFVHGILTSDLLMKSIHVYVAEEGYAARVQDTRSYESISKDILSRWTFPLVPDDNHPGGHIYEHTRGNRYIAKDNTVILARTANIGTNTLIGSSAKVAENVSIAASVIGQNCTIGPGTTIKNSYIFENAVIGANCTVERSIVGAGVTVKDNSVVPKGCLIGDRVVIGPNATLQSFERLSVKKKREVKDVTEREEGANADADVEDEGDDSDIEEVERSQGSIDKTSLGKDSNAIVWPRGPPDDDDEDEDEGPENWKNQHFMRLGDTGVVSEDDSSTTEDDSSSDDDFHDRESLSGISDISMPDIPGEDAKADAEFQHEVKLSLQRAFAEGHSVDNASVELKTLRMASNVPLTRVKEAVIGSIVEQIPLVDGDMAAQRKEIGGVVRRWGDLINKIGGIDPVETLSILQAHTSSSTRMPIFGQILAALYQADIVEEDDIRKWHRTREAQGEDLKPGVDTDNFKKCWVIGSHMIKQFDAQDSESESESEADDSDKEEEEEVKKREKAKDTATETETESEKEKETESEKDTETESEAENESETESAKEEEKVTPPAARVVVPTASQKETEATVEAKSLEVPASGSEKKTAGKVEKESVVERAEEEEKLTPPVSSAARISNPTANSSQNEPEATAEVEAKAPVAPAADTEKDTESESELESAKEEEKPNSAPVVAARAADPTTGSEKESESESEKESETESAKEDEKPKGAAEALPAKPADAVAATSDKDTTSESEKDSDTESAKEEEPKALVEAGAKAPASLSDSKTDTDTGTESEAESGKEEEKSEAVDSAPKATGKEKEKEKEEEKPKVTLETSKATSTPSKIEDLLKTPVAPSRWRDPKPAIDSEESSENDDSDSSDSTEGADAGASEDQSEDVSASDDSSANPSANNSEDDDDSD